MNKWTPVLLPAALLTGIGGVTIYNLQPEHRTIAPIEQIQPDQERLTEICRGIDVNWAIEQTGAAKILTHPREYLATFKDRTANLCKSRTFLQMGDWVAVQIYFYNPNTNQVYYFTIPPELRGEAHDRTLKTADSLCAPTP